MARGGVRIPATAVLIGILLWEGCGGGGGGLPGTSGGTPSDTVSGRIAFDTRRSAGTDVWTVNADGTTLTRVTSLGSAETQPTWSPDGVSLAFVSDNKGVPLIYRSSAAGGSATPVTTKPAGNGDLQPAWSPDGQWIAFTRDLGLAGGGTIMKIHPDGTGLVLLINGDSVGADGTNPVRNPAWSPSGTRLAFWRGSVDLCTVGIDGTELHVVATVTGGAGPISWSPDGNRLAFAAQDGTGLRIFAVDTTGANQVRLAPPPGSWSPAWSPNGQHLAFVKILTTPVNPNGEIMVGDADGDNAYSIASINVDDEHPAWQP